MNEVIFDKNDTYEYEHNICKIVFNRHFKEYEYEKDDIISEAWEYLATMKSSYNPFGSYFAYCYACAKNSMKAYVIKLKYKNRVLNSLDDTIDEDSSNSLLDLIPTESVENEYEMNNKYNVLINICKEIIDKPENKPYKAIYEMLLQEYSGAEISEKTKIPNKVVYYRIDLFRNELKSKLVENGILPISKLEELKIIEPYKFYEDVSYSKIKSIINGLCANLRKKENGEIYELVISGYTGAEISKMLNLNDAYVYRKIKEFEKIVKNYT